MDLDRRRRRRVLLAVTWALALAFLALFSWSIDRLDHREAPGLQWTQAQRVAQADLRPPPVDARWQMVALPDHWTSKPAPARTVWYRIAFHAEQVSEASRLALFLPSVSQNVAVHLNGAWLGQSGSLSDPVARNWNRPLLFTFARDNLQAGTNILDLRVRAQARDRGWLTRPVIGAEAELRPVWRLHTTLRVDMERWITTGLLLIATFLFAMWLFRPRERMYLWLSLSAASWALHQSNNFLLEIPMADWTWEALVIVSMVIAILASGMFINRYVGAWNPRRERAVLIGYGLLLAPLAVPDVDWVLAWGYGPALLPLFPLGAFFVFQLCRRYLQTGESELLVMIAAGLATLVFAGQDILTAARVGLPSGLFMLKYAAAAKILSLSFLLLRRFVGALDRAEELAATLEARVAARENELRSAFERNRELQRDADLQVERERIMLDIHDGIGGNLVAARALVVAEEVPRARAAAELDESLASLRLVMDSLEQESGDPATLLGTVRHRMQPALEAGGWALNWQVVDVPDAPRYGPERALEFMRIVQEALTNVLRHGHGPNLEVRLAPSDDGVLLTIINDARHSSAQGVGRGLFNMRRRAERLAAHLEIEVCDGRFELRLGMPAHA